MRPSSPALDEFRGPWFTTEVAARYVGSKTIKGFYEWCRRHRIVRASNGRIAKADLDRVMRQPRRVHTVTAASLDNLRHARQASHRDRHVSECRRDDHDQRGAA